MTGFCQPVHPLGKSARVLLTSVFGPYGRDDQFGSRKINPMELYQNQVTRVQGAFSLRMFHRSFGLMMIQQNIDAPCTLLDFPTIEEFCDELCNNAYDVIGIGAIIPNIGKVRKMCETIRRYQPHAAIVVGGHVTNMEGIEKIIDADHIVRGEGIRWFQRYLEQDDKTPIRHPHVLSGFGSRFMGIGLEDRPSDTAAILIPSVGCPIGCNFCSTSALFGGKGKHVNFYETGDELFAVMCEIEKKQNVQSFFVLDENFLLYRKRALRLLELIEYGEKSWSIYVFSSARVLKSYSIDQLVRMGVSWVWLGLEGEKSAYGKLKNIDTRALVDDLQAHGIRVLGSTIIGLEDHAPENIDEVIDYAVGHGTVFHQFMLYTPLPGTKLYDECRKKGLLLSDREFDLADAHGQYRFNYRHPGIREGQEEKYLLHAFQKDFLTNGPSLLRMIRVLLNGWNRYGRDFRSRIRRRIVREAHPLRTSYAGAVWAMRKWYGKDQLQKNNTSKLLMDLYKTFGWKTRFIAPLIGRFVFIALIREHKRLGAGWTYEPHSFHEMNAAAREEKKRKTRKSSGTDRERFRDYSPVVGRRAETFGE